MAYANRWTGPLLELPVDESAANGEEPFLEDVLHEARLALAPEPSRLPAPPP